MKTLMPFFVLSFFLFACVSSASDKPKESLQEVLQELQAVKEAHSVYKLFFDSNPDYHAKGFDFPVGKPNGKGYYNAQGFTKNNHLGEDWNAVTGGDSDLGDPIYAIANGYVYSAKHEGPGWGNVIRVVHFSDKLNPHFVESVYAHCDTMWVSKDQAVKKGDQIGTIGNADGAYLSHLHLELRDSLEMPIGGGYDTDTRGFINPTEFIKANREE